MGRKPKKKVEEEVVRPVKKEGYISNNKPINWDLVNRLYEKYYGKEEANKTENILLPKRKTKRKKGN